MRDILFKAKRKDNGEWVEGVIIKYKNQIMLVKSCTNDHLSNFAINLVWNEVIPETVCQYTGLQDKNGKKIFESDILSDGKEKWFVEYSETSTGFQANKKSACDCSIFSLYHLCTKHNEGREVEIIGNIYNREAD